MLISLDGILTAALAVGAEQESEERGKKGKEGKKPNSYNNFLIIFFHLLCSAQMSF